MAASLSKPMRIVLILSLALNLFGIGAITASAVTHDGWLAEMVGSRDHRLRIMGIPSSRQLRAALPENDQAILEQVLDVHRPKLREKLRDLFAARRTVAEAVRAEPFDRARLDAAFAALREREASIAAEAQATISDLIARLDAEGRDTVAELLTTRHKRRD